MKIIVDCDLQSSKFILNPSLGTWKWIPGWGPKRPPASVMHLLLCRLCWGGGGISGILVNKSGKANDLFPWNRLLKFTSRGESTWVSDGHRAGPRDYF